MEEDASQTQNFVQVALTGEELILKEEKINLCNWWASVTNRYAHRPCVCC